jgi:PAS domain-containing protein
MAAGGRHVAERANSDRGGAARPIEFDRRSGELRQDGQPVTLTGAELVHVLRRAISADQAKASAIVEALAEPIVIFGPEGNLEWANTYAQFMFGAPNVVRGTPCHLLVCDNTQTCADCPVEEFGSKARNPGTVRLQRELRTAEGFLHPFELVLRRMPGDEERRSTMVFIRDIGEQSAHEVRLRDQLRRRDLRLEVSDLLLSSTSLSETLSRFCDTTAKALDLCTIAVLLQTAGGWFVLSHGLRSGRQVSVSGRIVPSSGAGLRTVLSSGRPMHVRDVDRSAAALSISAIVEQDPGAGAASMVVAPLKGRSGDVVGALVAGRVAVDGFDQDDVQAVEALAARLAMAAGGLLAAEASARVARLQKAVIELGPVMAARVTDFQSTAKRLLEGLVRGAGLPLAGAVLVDPRSSTVQLFDLYTEREGHRPLPSPAYPLSACAFMASLEASTDVQLAHPARLLPAEREDPVLTRLLLESDGGIAFVPAAVEGATLGWFALGIPDAFWFSTPAEVEVLRSLAQQTRIALSWIVSDGRLVAMLDDLKGKRPGPP